MTHYNMHWQVTLFHPTYEFVLHFSSAKQLCMT
jgi:hypothetical protein